MAKIFYSFNYNDIRHVAECLRDDGEIKRLPTAKEVKEIAEDISRYFSSVWYEEFASAIREKVASKGGKA